MMLKKIHVMKQMNFAAIFRGGDPADWHERRRRNENI
jgi:hypothetical protein